VGVKECHGDLSTAGPGKTDSISFRWLRMPLTVSLLLLAAFSLSAFPASSAQTVDPQTGAVCEPQPTGIETVRRKAEAGNASAEYQLGRSMLSRRPTDSEFALASPWFQRSAEQGYAPAEYMYGQVFRTGRWKDHKQLVYWWTKAAEKGEVRAQLWLGVFYEQGRYGIEHDYYKAFKWLSLAATKGQPDAEVELGEMYENGEGVTQDYRMASYWYRKAADHTLDLGGAGVGAVSLVQLYQDGHTTSQDFVFVYLAYARAQDKDGMQELARKMSARQLADAQHRVEEWIEPRLACPVTELMIPPDDWR
jgi:TPR repeat protein